MFLRGQTIGKYRVLSHLGSGGFGSVYLAEDTWIKKNVAIKVPHKQNLDFSELLKEPRLLASMSHPNIVTMLTAEKLDDVFFIVMEYVPGETLEQLIIREGALELGRALDYTCQMCNAVDHAHRAGVLHRDIRPGNMLLSDTELLKEPRLLASMSHPNIVTMLTAEKLDDVFFIVMEYVPGETLEQLIIREGALELGRALDYTCQMCNAVDHAHRAGVLHRDIRPGNMLLSETGLLKVTDFGTSRFLEIAAHGTTVIGSPPYMAPEQFHGKAVFASDVYSVGVTMYQMVTGELPYNTPAPSDIERLMRGELVTAPRVRNSKIPKTINDIIMRALAPDLTLRYQRAADLLEDLLPARAPAGRRAKAKRTAVGLDLVDANVADIHSRLRARETPQARFCWQCRKPLHARSDRCPFCNEAQ